MSEPVELSTISEQEATNGNDAPTPANDVETGRRSSPPRTNRRASLLGTRLTASSMYLVRTSDAVDLETGAAGVKEAVVEEVRQSAAMDPTTRFIHRVFRIQEEEDEDDSQKEPRKQYRLTSEHKDNRAWWQKLTGIDRSYDDTSSIARHSGWLTQYLRWTFHTSFWMLFLTSALTFWTLCFLFAVIFYAVGLYQPECIVVAGVNFREAGSLYTDAFALSWTTFSTVGYGLIYPQLAIQGGPRCFSINLFATLESFTGILFGGFMSAIIFGKVTRNQSFATVTFSDPMVVRYGSGLMETTRDGDESSSCKSLEMDTHIPCPVLEFRVANRMHSCGRGEIVNATINVVASTLASKASEQSIVLANSIGHYSLVQPNTTAKQPNRATRIMSGTKNQVTSVAGTVGRKVGGTVGKTAGAVTGTVGRTAGAVTGTVGRTAGAVTGTVGRTAGAVTGKIKSTLVGDAIDEEQAYYDPDVGVTTAKSPKASVLPYLLHHKKVHNVVDEGSKLVPRRIFSNLEIETPAHPFFKRVWNIRHVLDQNSPLLSAKAKVMIANNGGWWPLELNSYQAVRENIHFHEIIVNLRGTANATGNTVFGQKVYSFVDMNVGYSLVNVLCRDKEDRLVVDMKLLNDVQEQRGGGAEPFTDVVDKTNVFDRALDAARLGPAVDVAVEARDKAVGVATGARDKAAEAASQARDKAAEAFEKKKDSNGLVLEQGRKLSVGQLDSSGGESTSTNDVKKDA